MKNIILVGTLLLSAIAVSLSYNMKNETGMSELVEANIEALSKESLNRYPCIKNKDTHCTEWVIISNGPSGAIEYPGYMNYMEGEVDE